MDGSVSTLLPQVSLVSVSFPGSYYSVLNARLKIGFIDPSDDPAAVLVLHYGIGTRSLLKPVGDSVTDFHSRSDSQWEFVRSLAMTRDSPHAYSCELTLPVLSRGNDEALNELDFVFLRIDGHGAHWIKGSETSRGYYAADLGGIIAVSQHGLTADGESIPVPVLPVAASW